MNSFWDSLKVMSVVSLDVLSENRKGLASQEFCSCFAEAKDIVDICTQVCT